MASPLLGVALGFAFAAGALAQGAGAFPTKTVRFIVPFPPGAGTDIIARAFAAKMTEGLGQQVVVDNRPGASTILASEMVAKAPPDGHTIIIASNNHAINSALFAKLPYDPVADFTAIGKIGELPFVLIVHPSIPARTVKDLVALARARPGQMHFASTGNGSPPHVGGELLRQQAKIDVVHVPYKGSAPALTDLIGGQVSFMFANTLSSMPHVRGGRLRALAVGAKERISIAPELPTVAESGGLPGFDVSLWTGILGPANMPRDVVTRLNREFVRVAGLADVRERLRADGAELKTGTPEEFAALIRSEIVRLGNIARAAKMKVD